MKKFTWTKILAWIFIIIPILISGYHIWVYSQTLSNFQISEKFIVEFEWYKWNYLIDLMQYKSYFFEKNKIILDMNNTYSWAINPKNNWKNSWDGKYLAKNGWLFLNNWKRIFMNSWWYNDSEFHWTNNWEYYLLFLDFFPKWPHDQKIYIYNLKSQKYIYLDLVDTTWNKLTVSKFTGIVP